MYMHGQTVTTTTTCPEKRGSVRSAYTVHILCLRARESHGCYNGRVLDRAVLINSQRRQPNTRDNEQ